jgi:hypothetical protein
MPYSVDQLKSEISSGGGLARPNLYQVLLPSIGMYSTSSLDVLCKGVNMPGKQIMTTEKTIGTITQKIAWGFTNDDVNLRFIGLNDHGVRRYFENWMGLVVNHESGHTVNYKNEYERDIIINQLDHHGSVTYAVKLLGAYPIQLLDLEYSSEGGTLMDIASTVTYTRWERADDEHPDHHI